MGSNDAIRPRAIIARDVTDFYESRMVIERPIMAPLAGRLSVGRADRIEGLLDRLWNKTHRPAGWMHRVHPERLAGNAAVLVGMGGARGKWNVEGMPEPGRVRPGSMPCALAP